MEFQVLQLGDNFQKGLSVFVWRFRLLFCLHLLDELEHVEVGKLFDGLIFLFLDGDQFAEKVGPQFFALLFDAPEGKLEHGTEFLFGDGVLVFGGVKLPDFVEEVCE